MWYALELYKKNLFSEGRYVALKKAGRVRGAVVRFSEDADTILLSLLFGKKIGEPLAAVALTNPKAGWRGTVVLIHKRGNKLTTATKSLGYGIIKQFLSICAAANERIGAVTYTALPRVVRMPKDILSEVLGKTQVDVLLTPEGIMYGKVLVKGKTMAHLSNALKRVVMSSLTLPQILTVAEPRYDPALPALKKIVRGGPEAVREMSDDEVEELAKELYSLPYVFRVGDNGALYIGDIPFQAVSAVLDIPTLPHGVFIADPYARYQINDALIKYFKKRYRTKDTVVPFPLAHLWGGEELIRFSSLLKAIQFEQVRTAEDLVASSILAVLDIKHSMSKDGEITIDSGTLDDIDEVLLKFLGCRKSDSKYTCHTNRLALKYLLLPNTKGDFETSTTFRNKLLWIALENAGIVKDQLQLNGTLTIIVDDKIASIIAYLAREGHIATLPTTALHVGMLRDEIKIEDYYISKDRDIVVKASIGNSRAIVHITRLSEFTHNAVVATAPDTVDIEPLEIIGALFRDTVGKSGNVKEVTYRVASTKQIHRTAYHKALRDAIAAIKHLFEESENVYIPYGGFIRVLPSPKLFRVRAKELVNVMKKIYALREGAVVVREETLYVNDTPLGDVLSYGVIKSWGSVLASIRDALKKNALEIIERHFSTQKAKEIVRNSLMMKPLSVYDLGYAVLNNDPVPSDAETMAKILVAASALIAALPFSDVIMRFDGKAFIVSYRHILFTEFVEFTKVAESEGCEAREGGIVCGFENLIASTEKLLTNKHTKVTLNDIIKALKASADKTFIKIGKAMENITLSGRGVMEMSEDIATDDMKMLGLVVISRDSMRRSDAELYYSLVDALYTTYTTLKKLSL